MVKDVPQGQWFLGRWEEGAATIDAASFRDKKGRWWRAEIDDLGHPVFRIVSDPPVAWARPLPLDKRLELGVSYGVTRAEEANYEPVGVPPWRVWPSCSSARSSTFLIAASFSASLIFRRSRRRIIPPKRNMAPSMIADAAMR